MRESKITATERLRRNGDWETASLYRDDQRKRLRSEGMRRREANEESWRLMLEAFPPPDEDARSWYMALAEFPPTAVPDDRQVFTDVWRVYCRLKAYLCFCDPELARAENSSETTERRLRVEVPAEDTTTECPTERTNQLLVSGFKDPSGFLDQTEAVFRDAGQRIGGETPETVATHDELVAFLDGIPRLRQAAARHWPTFGASGLSS